MTLTDIAVDMWNHAPRMLQPPPTLSEDEMRSLLSYLWMRQFVYGGGDVAQGKRGISAAPLRRVPRRWNAWRAATAGPGQAILGGIDHLGALAAWPADGSSYEGSRHRMAHVRRTTGSR
ncbi:MAG: hypothetical protein WDO73_07530 [Ignavibacteriota bacterium]